MIYGNEKNGNPSIEAILQSSNLYAYTINNPLRYIDPVGLRTYIINGIANPNETGPPQYSEDLKQELLNEGVQNVRTIGVYNGTNVLSGTWNVIKEMANSGDYADNVLDIILTDLANYPLAEGEELNLIGYSGGGQIALNVAEKLEGTYTVNNTILIGAPVAELTLNNTGTTVSMWAAWDPLSWNVSWNDVKFEFAGWFGHTDYFNSDNLVNTANIINKYIN